MQHELATRARVQGGVLTTDDAVQSGALRGDLTRLVRSGALVRVRSGAYVDATAWGAEAAAGRYRLTALAVGRALRDGWALSHVSALAVHDLPLVRPDPDVHVSRLRPGTWRHRPGLVTHIRVDPSDTSEVSGVTVVTPALAVVQTAAWCGVEAGVVAADAAIRRRTVTRSSLETALGPLRGGRGVRRAVRAVALADGRAESPGESRARVQLVTAGLGEVVPQVEIWDGGVLVGRVDLLVEGRVVVEFDGLVKYAGADGRAALVAEKRREDALRALGYEVVRLTWADLRPELVVTAVRAALARSRR